MPKFTKVKRIKGQKIGSSPGGSPRFTSSNGGKAKTNRIKRLKPKYTTYKNRNFRGD